MATYNRPGVYVEETLLAQDIQVDSTSTAVGAFLGKSPRGPVVSTRVNSWTEFVRLYGTFDASYQLHFAVYQFFVNGGKTAYIRRIVGSGAASANVSLTDRAGSPLATLRITAANPGAWANSTNATTGLSVEVKDNGTTDRFDLVVYQGGSSTPSGLNVVERFTDLSMDANDARYVVRQINSTSSFVIATDLASATAAPSNRPSASGVKTLSTGADGSAPAQADYVAALTRGNAAAAFDDVSQSLVLNVPDTTAMLDATAIAVLQQAGIYADDRGDVFVIADVTATTADTAGAIAFAGSVMAGTLTGANVALYYPYVTVADPIGAVGTTRTLPPGGALVGLFLKTDTVSGPQKAPAGLGAALSNVLAPAVKLTASNLDSLNTASVPVNAIKSVPGAGVCVMGARTMRTKYSDRYVPVRRSLIYIKKALKDATQFAVFENNDERLWERLNTVCTAFLRQYWQEGGLRGGAEAAAFYVKCDATVNTPSVIANGEVRVEVGVALQTPAEFVVIRIGQFEGGASATDDTN